MTSKVTPSDFADAVQRYLSGEQTQSEAATSIGLSQPSFSSRLRRNGYPTLTRGEAMKRRLERMTPAERSALSAAAREAVGRRIEHMTPVERSTLSAAAHDAVRGMTRTDEDLFKRARGKQRTQAHATSDERAVADYLTARGVPVVLQQAVGKYNLDLGVDSAVAVELFGGGWHGHGRHRARLPERVDYIADAGWNLHIVWSANGFRPEPGPIAEDVLAYLERTRSDPSFRRQYRVIRGDGKFLAAGSVDDDERTLIPTGVRGAYTRWSVD